MAWRARDSCCPPACLVSRKSIVTGIRHDMPAAKILPGEYYVTSSTELVTTVLGPAFPPVFVTACSESVG